MNATVPTHAEGDGATPAAAMIDGNEAAATIAYQASEVIAIYPITPSSPMGELADQWSVDGRANLWGAVPRVIEMQSEGGAAGVLHGALQAGALCTTFTASQGLLLMIPNMYKIAGELTPTVIHVAARSLATYALSIFGDHSDVMAARATGFALLASSSVQEAMDLALVAHAATLESRVPFLHFFDGFRTSHEVAKVAPLAPGDVAALLDVRLVYAHRARALSVEPPTIRGTAQNPDVFFQAREAANPYYLACPAIVERVMASLAARTGRRYRLFDYVGAPDAERVIVMMGSGAETAAATVRHLAERGEKVGLVIVRLFRPFSVGHFVDTLPPSVHAIAALDRTKEPGAVGEPLYLDVVSALAESERTPRVVGGRYGLSSKEFTPAMVRAVLDELARPKPRNHFTVGIRDDVTHTSLDVDTAFTLEDPTSVRAVFYGLGADGTVGANKSTIKIIGEETGLHAQGYFVYDSKKSGSMTISHLRFGAAPIRAPYLVQRASFVGCHQFSFLERVDVLTLAEPGATVLVNSPFGPNDVWRYLPCEAQRTIRERRLRLFVIDAARVAADAGMGGRVNTVMQTCFFALSGVLPREDAVAAIKRSIEKTYGKRGEAVVRRNCAAVDAALAHLCEVQVEDASIDGPRSSRRTPSSASACGSRTTTRPRMRARCAAAWPRVSVTRSSPRCAIRRGAVSDLTTRYLGLDLVSPLVVSASPIGERLDDIRRAEDAGAGAVVLPSLFEEQMLIESYDLDRHLSHGSDSHAEALSYFPDMGDYNLGPEGYLEHVRRAREAVAIPVIGSLNGVSAGGWLEYARRIEEAGAAAIELNVYYIPTDPELPGGEVEATHVELVRAVKATVSIPVAVKLGP